MNTIKLTNEDKKNNKNRSAHKLGRIKELKKNTSSITKLILKDEKPLTKRETSPVYPQIK